MAWAEWSEGETVLRILRSAKDYRKSAAYKRGIGNVKAIEEENILLKKEEESYFNSISLISTSSIYTEQEIEHFSTTINGGRYIELLIQILGSLNEGAGDLLDIEEVRDEIS